jgi:pimeloyl-ACP methyl ester carboxylesterase
VSPAQATRQFGDFTSTQARNDQSESFSQTVICRAMQATPFDDAKRIRPGERDHHLDLDDESWPQVTREGWTTDERGWLMRRIVAGDKSPLAHDLNEAILRFPAAPIHGIHRMHEGHSRAGQALNFHTYRTLTSTKFKGQAKRIYLLNNGLNELTSMGLYYELASHIIAEDPKGTACVIRPFPGHLTRFPYDAYGEQPLDRYLWDGSELFRQFIRYMIETQWFLSAIVNRSDYRGAAGANLNAEGSEPADSRLKTKVLARSIRSDWDALYDVSDGTLAVELQEQGEAPEMKARISGKRPYRETIRSMRRHLGLDRYPKLDGHLLEDQEEPDLHVVGYSLGGFTAQSIFMSWPYIVGSCSTLLSGGPLRELAPTAFAHPEEWQTVLHSLRYELDEAMTRGRFNRTDTHIAGMDKDAFLYFQRTFYEVFQQEYRGSFQSRLAAFRSRMFFVVGGDDPIVRPRSVLDSGPPGGINLFEIGGLGHFIASTPKEPEEQAQRKFWLPEVGKLIARFAKTASEANRAGRDDGWLDENLLVKPRRKERRNPVMRRLEDSERGLDSGALPGRLFERHLDDLLARISEQPNGYLWVLRNEVPALLLGAHSVQRRALAVHHDDQRFAEYCRGVADRSQVFEQHKERIGLILPWNAKRIMQKIDDEDGFPSQSETAVGKMQNQVARLDEWQECVSRCKSLVEDCEDSVRIFDGRDELSGSDERPDVQALVEIGLRAIHRKGAVIAPGTPLRVPAMPDCWIWVGPEFLSPAIYREPKNVRERFNSVIAQVQPKDDHTLEHAIQHDLLRVITVSRARYNPRYRGRLVTDVPSVRSVLLRAALCISAARPFLEFDWERETFSDPEESV